MTVGDGGGDQGALPVTVSNPWRLPRRTDVFDTETTLWALAVVATIADSLLTLAGLQLSLSEGNPAMVAALSAFGVPGLVLVKGLALAWAAFVWWSLSDRNANIALGLFVGVTLAVVFNNTFQILVTLGQESGLSVAGLPFGL